MARIIVTPDTDPTRVLMDERAVGERHLTDSETAVDLLERLAWAIESANDRIETPRRKKRRRVRS